MTLKFLAVGVMAATLIGCADAIEVPTPEPDNSGNIVYTEVDFSKIDNSEDYAVIKLIASDGKPIRTIGLGMVGEVGKNKIAFIRTDEHAFDGQGDIYVCNSDGTGERKLAEIRGIGQKLLNFPTISANGQVIAYSTRDSTAPQVYKRVLHVVNADGSGHRVISEKLAYESQFGLSPDGSLLAFFSDEPIGNGTSLPGDLEVARTDGSGAISLLTDVDPGADNSAMFAWNNAGNKIAFTIGGSDKNVHIINPDGSGHLTVGIGGYPAWSPNDSLLAWSSVPQQSGHRADIVYTADLGVSLTYLTSTSEAETHPQFSSNGKEILCTQWLDDATESPGNLKVIDLTTGAARVLASNIFTAFWTK